VDSFGLLHRSIDLAKGLAMNIPLLLATGLGGGLGAIARVSLSRLMPDYAFSDFPIPILVVNVLGCFLMGLLVEIMAFYWSPSMAMRSFLITGFLGGFTTFSAFSLEFTLLAQKNLNYLALLYAVLSFALSITAFIAGAKLIKVAAI
jgi:fluoride exporter